MTQAIDLTDLSKHIVDGERTAIFSFMDGFKVELRFLAKKDLQRLIKKCTRTVYKKHVQTEELDSAAFAVEMARYIKGWSGLTPEICAKIIPVDAAKLGSDEIPCTEANKIALIDNGYDFEKFLEDSITSFERFQLEAEKGQLENL